MAALTDISDVVNRYTGGNSGTPENLWWHKVPRQGGAAVVGIPNVGRPFSMWAMDGHPGPGAAPGAWANPDNTTAGGLLQADPGGGRQKWLTQFFATSSIAGTVILYDRLGHNSGLNATTTSAQTFTGTLTRYTNGIGNIMWYEIYGNTTTILGSTGTTLTVSYTNENGTAGRTSASTAIGGTVFREGNQARFVPLQSGDKGIQSVENVDLVVSTGTAGDFGITVGHPLAFATIGSSGVGGWRDFITGLPGIPEILTDACLAFLWIPLFSTPPEHFGCLSTIEK